MEIRNFTPLSPLVFESETVDRTRFHVVVARGCFRIVPDRRLVFASQPEPLVMADQYYGDPAKSSLLAESDLAPYKPTSDIHIENAIAYAPDAKPTRSWEISVQVGSVRKQLRVHGPRNWFKRRWSGWSLSEPESCTAIPIRYELAYGGWWQHGDQSDVCQENPIGRGVCNVKQLKSEQVVPAPQIESLADPIDQIGKRHRPEGLGPICRGWQPRLRLAGTFDDVWQRTKWPGLPDDFDFAHYNSAHPDLITPQYMSGAEDVELVGLHPAGSLRFSLPGHTVIVVVRFSDGEILPAPMRLDTTIVNAGNGTCSLVWRGGLPRQRPIRVVELRLIP